MNDFFYGVATIEHSLFFYGAVLLVSALYSLILVFLIRDYTLKDRMRLLLFYVLVDFVVLGFGFILSTAYTIYVITHRPKKYIHNVSFINFDEFKVDFKSIKRIFGEGSLQQAVSDKNAPNSFRLKALNALSSATSKENIAIIKDTLTDTTDEIRLYSFSIIDSMEKEINLDIRDKLKMIKEVRSNEDRIDIYIGIINNYWDLIYFGLSDSALENFVIKKIKHYAMLALEISDKNPILYTILGKAFMFEKKYDLARKSFTKAIKNGANSNFVKPYLAEIMFDNRKFANVHKILNDTKGLESNNTLYPVVAQWKDI